MTYDNHDANVIKSALEHHLGDWQPHDDHKIRDALAALERLVMDYLPEGATDRQLRSMTRTTRTPNPEELTERPEHNPNG